MQGDKVLMGGLMGGGIDLMAGGPNFDRLYRKLKALLMLLMLLGFRWCVHAPYEKFPYFPLVHLRTIRPRHTFFGLAQPSRAAAASFWCQRLGMSRATILTIYLLE